MIFVDYPGNFVAIFFLAVAALLVFLAFHCRELRKKEFKTFRLLLIGLKYIAILILLLILWNPSQSKETDTYSKNSVLALFDTSKSMSIIEDSKTTRLDKALEIFDDNFQFSNKDTPEFSILGFDTQVYHSGSTKLLRQWGQQTDMQSVFNTLRKYDDSGSPNNEEESLNVSKYKGAVIFTDGQVDDQSVSTYLPLVRGDFPIVIVGIGSRELKPDVAIKSFAPQGIP